jgi:hypothetical protein
MEFSPVRAVLRGRSSRALHQSAQRGAATKDRPYRTELITLLSSDHCAGVSAFCSSAFFFKSPFKCESYQSIIRL